MRNSRRQSEILKYDLWKRELVFDNNIDKKENKWLKKWIIYARVSTEEQRQKGNGINAQISDCERWAVSNGVEIVWLPYKDEAVSWINLQRKQFLEAIRFLEKENKKWTNIDYFICASTSRFSRSSNLSNTFDMVARVEITWAKLVAISNWWIQDTDSEEWLLMFWLNTIIDAVESKRWQKRVRAGQKGKVYEWLRPFPDVPLWYERIVEKIWWKEVKLLIRKDPEASILNEWLRLFADWILLTKQQLYDFFNDRWLKSNSKKNKSWKLHPSIIDRILDVWKLYVYAGYLTYPDWGINELIQAKHPQIIDLDIVDKIMNRLYRQKWIVEHSKRKYDDDADEYPLKRILLCPECDKAVTKRKSLSKTGDYHHYYWCNTKWCSLFKKALPRDIVHKAIEERLKEITPPKESIEMFEKAFNTEWENAQKDVNIINQTKKLKIKSIELEMSKIERTIDNITDKILFAKKQSRWSELNQEKENLQYDMEDIRFTKEEFEKTYKQAKLVIKDPLSLRKLDDVEIKQLVIRVCFNDKIYYKKKEWLHTPETSVLHTYISQFSLDKTPNLEMMGFEPMSKRHI